MTRAKDLTGIIEFWNGDSDNVEIQSKYGSYNYTFKDIETIATALNKSVLEVLYDLSLKVGNPTFKLSDNIRPYQDLIEKSNKTA